MNGKEKQKNINGKVLSFEKKGELFFKRGVAMVEKHNLVDALMNFNRALACDDENEEFIIATAEVLAQMGRFYQSNRIIFMYFPDAETRPAECFFGLGCNFIAMCDYENGKACLEQYLALKPDGEYVYDACDMLDAIEEYEDTEDDSRLALTELKEASLELPSIREIMDAGDDKDNKFSVENVEKMIKAKPELYFLRNLIALKYYFNNDIKNAAKQIEMIFKQDACNIHAHCTMTMLAATGEGDAKRFQKEIEYIKNYKTDSMEDLNRIALTLLEYSTPHDAYHVLNRMYSQAPYEPAIIHKLGICLYAMGEYERAWKCYDRILKMDCKDSVAMYYRSICKQTLATGIKKSGLMLEYEVPMDEIVARVKHIKALIDKPREEGMRLWKDDGATQRLLIWSIRSHEIGGLKRAMLTMIASFGDRMAEMALREYLLIKNEPDDIKREVFGLLSHMHAKEPYLGYICGKFVESRVSIVDFMGKVNKPYRDVLSICIENMDSKYSPDALIFAARIWKNYLCGSEELPSITRNQVLALSVVLEYISATISGFPADKHEFCVKYGISLLRFDNAYAKLKPYIKEDNGDIE